MAENNQSMSTKNMAGRLEEELKASLVGGYVPCTVAFQIAKGLGINRRQVGDMANTLKLRISNCQLDCFIVDKTIHVDPDSKDVSRALAEAVQVSSVAGKLSCSMAFSIAKKIEVDSKVVADAVNKLKIKLSDCQLGCFP